jgi:hypothetical protein
MIAPYLVRAIACGYKSRSGDSCVMKKLQSSLEFSGSGAPGGVGVSFANATTVGCRIELQTGDFDFRSVSSVSWV